MSSGVGRCRFTRGRGTVQVTGLAVCAVLVIAGCSANSSPVSTGSAQAGGTPSGSSPVKTVDPAALQAKVDAAAKEMMIPGAVVEVRTPQGRFHGCRRHDRAGLRGAAGR
jgi:D-alanyl-D-alanine carboxypeptidase